MSTCQICYSNIEKEDEYRCCDPRCLTRICEECIMRYIEIVVQDKNKLLNCVGDSCTGVYDEESIRNLSDEYIIMFRRHIFNYFSNTDKQDILGKVKTIDIVLKLQQERMKFLIEKMPKALFKVARIVMPSKLKKVKLLQEKKPTNLRVCMLLFCKGFLDDNFKCDKCETLFCKECEGVVHENHVCKEEDKMSLKYMQSVVKCPTCGTKAEKISGCDATTCAICGTNFWFTTGESGEVGNHTNTHIRLKEKRLVTEYEFPDEFITEIIQLESIMQRKSRDEEEVIKTLIAGAYTLEDIDDGLLKKVSRAYSKMVKTRMINVITSSKLKAIENLAKEGDFGKIRFVLDLYT